MRKVAVINEEKIINDQKIKEKYEAPLADVNIGDYDDLIAAKSTPFVPVGRSTQPRSPYFF